MSAADSQEVTGASGNHRRVTATTTAQARSRAVALELLITRTVDGVLRGDYRGLIPGPGTDPGEAREYQIGDDVRAMDWAVTARTTVPHVRQTIADRELETWLLVDLSPSIDAGGHRDSDSELVTKRDLALGATALFGFLSARCGNRVGLVIVGAGQPSIIPPRGGRDHVRALIERVAVTKATRDSDPASSARNSDSPDIPPQSKAPKAQNWRARLRELRSRKTAAATSASAIEQGARLLRGRARHRGLIVIVSDFLISVDWEQSLRALAPRHEIIGVRLTDPLDVTLPAVGPALLRDTATGELFEVNLTAQQAAEYQYAARLQRGVVSRALRRCGAPILALRTDQDWVRAVIEFSNLRRRGAFPDGERALQDLENQS